MLYLTVINIMNVFMANEINTFSNIEIIYLYVFLRSIYVEFKRNDVLCRVIVPRTKPSL
jgi:hypothetical protein